MERIAGLTTDSLKEGCLKSWTYLQGLTCNDVCIDDSGKAMRNHNGGAGLHEAVQRLLHQMLACIVQGTRCLHRGDFAEVQLLTKPYSARALRLEAMGLYMAL